MRKTKSKLIYAMVAFIMAAALICLLYTSDAADD